MENGWVNYNSLQQLMYFLVVFIAQRLREREDAVLLNLDRKALIVGTLARLEVLARA